MKSLLFALFGALVLTAFVNHPIPQTTDNTQTGPLAGPTPDEVYQSFKDGNARFLAGTSIHDLHHEVDHTADHQDPEAIVVGCIDSRVPLEIVFDQGIGQTFANRTAGNFIDEDAIGAAEFACTVYHAKLILIVGHTSCGAIKAACDGAGLTPGNNFIATMVEEVNDAAQKAKALVAGPYNSSNEAYVDATMRKNVELGKEELLRRSTAIAQLVKAGKVKLAGCIYHIDSGTAEFLN